MHAAPTITDSAPRSEHAAPTVDEILLASARLPENLRQSDLSLTGINCASCVTQIEHALGESEGVVRARVNLTSKRVLIDWRSEVGPERFLTKLGEMGYAPSIPARTHQAVRDETLNSYLRALAVAGFAAANVMLLSVSVWSGADATTRSLFHFLSALISVPALMYSGRVFYVSAWQALRHRHTNMDVPITVGILLATLSGLYDTATGGEHVYFEAAVSLVFFLLIGRTLDHMMRQRASRTIDGLTALEPRGACRIDADGQQRLVASSALRAGDIIKIEAGQRLPVDGKVEHGCSELDCSVVTGESYPQLASVGGQLYAGAMNLSTTLHVRVTADVENSFLARIRQMVLNAELNRGKHQRIADRAAKWYAPVVHSAAALSLLTWYQISGDLHLAISVAVAVLIITCPCAFGLAVPMVHVIAARQLLARGILMKNGAALERLPDIDAIVFDKTGTLTDGDPTVQSYTCSDPGALRIAQAMTQYSSHPFARAISKTVFPESAGSSNRLKTENEINEPTNIKSCPSVTLGSLQVTEHPGNGLEAQSASDIYRLGRMDWAVTHQSGSAEPGARQPKAGGSTTYLSRNGVEIAAFLLSNSLRRDAAASIAALREHSSAQIEILSGDNQEAVSDVAARLNIVANSHSCTPAEKTTHIQTLIQRGHTTLMIGDGINDCGALTAADVSMAPASAAEVGRNSADFVFLQQSLLAVPDTLLIAKKARTLVRQNIAIAITYNLIALPFAMLGHVTPLLAALAMSSSSILVVGNALRLRLKSPGRFASLAKAGASAPETTR